MGQGWACGLAALPSRVLMLLLKLLGAQRAKHHATHQLEMKQPTASQKLFLCLQAGQAGAGGGRGGATRAEPTPAILVDEPLESPRSPVGLQGTP